VLDWPACSPDVSPTENLSNTTKKTQDCWAAGVLHQTGMGQHSSPRGPAAGVLSSRCLQMLLKEEGTLHSGKHGPVPIVLRCFAAIKMSWYLLCHFQYWCFLCFTGSKLLVYEIWHLMYSVFYTASQRFGNWVYTFGISQLPTDVYLTQYILGHSMLKVGYEQQFCI